MRAVDVAAGIIWREGRFLAALRPEGRPRAGFWEFPGGKRETGENIEQALRRELAEELGIACGRLLPWKIHDHAYPDVRVVLHFIHVLDFAGEPFPRDGQELRWVAPREAPALNFLPADREIAASIRFPPQGVFTL